MRQGLRIGICGSAGVGKTTLVNALARALNLPTLREEMRDFLVRTRVDLTALAPAEVETILSQLWQERAAKERNTPAFVADNSPLDFAAYASFYACGSDAWINDALAHVACYDLLVVLPSGVLPYVRDGVRPDDPRSQLYFQALLEELVQGHILARKLYFMPPSVVQIEDRVDWLRSRLEMLDAGPAASPLMARRVLVARARPGQSQIANRLRGLGAEVLESPTIEELPLEDCTALDASLADLSRYDAVLLSCVPGARALGARLSGRGGLGAISQVICIGPQVREAVYRCGGTASTTLPGSCADALGQHAELITDKRLLLITSNGGRPQLARELLSLGALVHSVAAYRVRVCVKDRYAAKADFDLVILPSSTAVRNLYSQPLDEGLTRIPAIAIGPHTQAAAQQAGAVCITCTPRDDIDSVV